MHKNDKINILLLFQYLIVAKDTLWFWSTHIYYQEVALPVSDTAGHIYLL